MAYVLHGVLADFDRLRVLSGGVPGAVVAPLGQRLGLLPVTKEVFIPLARQEDGPFLLMSPEFAARLAEWSLGGPVAYVEAEYFGGTGEQAAALWDGGGLAWGPETGDQPINDVLARIGAVQTGALDLFDSVGLGQARNMDGWHRAGVDALDAAGYDAWEARPDR